MPVTDGTRTPTGRPTSLSSTGARPTSGNTRATQPRASGAIDHWTVVLFYSMGIGAVAVSILFFLVLMAVWMYGQFVWTFTHWDLADVRLTPYKSLAQLIVAGTFLGGTCAGLWCFSGAAWRNRTPARGNSTSASRKVR